MAVSQKVQRILNCIPSRNMERDWRIDDALMSGAVRELEVLPSSVDLREDWWKVGDQGATGSCVGWATADAVLRWHFVKAGRLKESEKLSVRFVWMAAKETDEFTKRPTTFIEISGTSLKAALTICKDYGAVPEAMLPFHNNNLSQDKEEVFFAKAAQYRISSYFQLTGFDQWRKWMATHGPILARLAVDNTWYNVPANGNLNKYDSSSSGNGHAVALVGYTPERFIVRNSWGTKWGEKGFAHASLEYAQAAFTEAYGVTI